MVCHVIGIFRVFFLRIPKESWYLDPVPYTCIVSFSGLASIVGYDTLG